MILQLMMLMSLSGAHATKTVALTPVTTCRWPNTCSAQTVVLAQVTTCVWPKACSEKAPAAPIL